jgi:hypothetical protein
MPKVSPHLQFFAPERLTHAEIFSLFNSATHKFNSITKRKISGVTNHLRKAARFSQLQSEHFHKLMIDWNELEDIGYTPAENSNLSAAIFESQITELYSAVDCTTAVIFQIYRHHHVRGLKDSTRGMFEKIRNGQIKDGLPEPLYELFINADWFEEFRIIRDEITHSDTGSCHFNKEQNRIEYNHEGIFPNDQPLNIANAVQWTEQTSSTVRLFIEGVFSFLRTTLSSNEVQIICGIFYGRPYTRKLGHEINLNLNSGECISRNWFDNNHEFVCPLKSNCGAYKITRISTTAELNA